MKNSEKLRNIFVDTLSVDSSVVTDSLKFNSIPEWDSIAHMALVTEIDDVFNIMLETDDVLDMSSFAKAKEILSKYDISFE